MQSSRVRKASSGPVPAVRARLIRDRQLSRPDHPDFIFGTLVARDTQPYAWFKKRDRAQVRRTIPSPGKVPTGEAIAMSIAGKVLIDRPTDVERNAALAQ